MNEPSEKRRVTITLSEGAGKLLTAFGVTFGFFSALILVVMAGAWLWVHAPIVSYFFIAAVLATFVAIGVWIDD